MKSWLTPGLIIAGIVLIITALLLPNRSIDFLGKKNLALVTNVKGSAVVEGLDQTDTSQIQKKTKIKNLDLIKTKSQSEVDVELNDIKADVKILENSIVLFEENTENAIVITIKEGDLTVESLGEKPDEKNIHFWIKKEGRQLSALDYSMTNESGSGSTKSKWPPQVAKNDILSQARIEEILNTKKNEFFRCYGQLIQKEEQAHGQLLLSFEILNTGKVQSVDITKTDLKQPFFLSCIKEVVLRTTFPTFNGKSVTTVFPLKFE